MLEWVQNFIAQTGFPIAVAAFVLWRLNGKFDHLTEAVRSLGDAMRGCQARHDLCDIPPARRRERT